MKFVNIGEAAAAAGVTPKMIRHYETLGLIPQAERTEAGYRLYGDGDIAMLRFIRQSRGLDFSIEQIDSLVSLWRDPARQSSDVKRVALQQLAQLEQRKSELDQMRGTLQDMVAQCRGDDTSHCAILETLALAPARRAPADLPTAGAGKSLKDVRAGERRAPRDCRPERPKTATTAPPHAALSAWAQSFARQRGEIHAWTGEDSGSVLLSRQRPGARANTIVSSE